MKKIITAVLLFGLIVSLAGCGETPVSTTETSATVERQFVTEGTTLKSCKGQADENGVFVVEDGVTEIGEGCFSGDTTLKEIVLSDSVVKIAEGAFYACTELEKVTFGTGLQKIGGGAFQYCDSLKSMDIPEGVTYIGSSAFYQCSSLKSVSLPSTLTMVDSYAFALCTKLTSVVLPDSVSFLGSCAFQACTALTEIKMSASVTEIPYQCFAQCSLLDTVDFTGCDKLETIGEYAFWRCSALKSIELPEGLKDIDNYAFYYCAKLNSVSIPKTLIGAGSFAFDQTPWYLELSDDYVIVGDGVLIKCNRTAAYLDLSGKGIKTLGGGVFRNTNGFFEGVDDYGSATYYGYSQAEYLTSVVIPEGVTRIEDSAFAGCGLQDISIPTSVEYIGMSAFYSAIQYGTDTVTGLTIFPDVDLSKCTNLSYIGDFAFTSCYGLKTITLPNDSVSIGAYAFFKTEAMYRFMEQCYYTNHDEDAFYVVGNTLLCAYVGPDTETVTIPDGIRNIAGTALIGWDSSLIANKEDFDTVSDADDLFDRNRFYLGYDVKEITIPDSVEIIGNQAFYSMRVLESVSVPSNVKSIGTAAFMNCYALKEINLEEGLTSIGDNAFQYCYELTTVTIPDSVSFIGDDIFDYCYALTTVFFPKSGTDIGDDLFSTECTALSKIFLASDMEGRVYGIVGTLYSATDRSALSVRYYIGE